MIGEFSWFSWSRENGRIEIRFELEIPNWGVCNSCEHNKYSVNWISKLHRSTIPYFSYHKRMDQPVQSILFYPRGWRACAIHTSPFYFFSETKRYHFENVNLEVCSFCCTQALYCARKMSDIKWHLSFVPADQADRSSASNRKLCKVVGLSCLI